MPSHDKNICEEKLFEETFRQHSKDLYKFLYYKYGADLNPADVVQESFVKLWENCSNVPPDKAKGYLFTVASNIMLNHVARRKTVLKFQKREQKNYTNENPHFVLEEYEYSKKIQEALNSLTEDQRVTFMLNRAEGKRHKEIAELLGISRKAVEKRIYKALEILRKKLKEI